MLKFSLATATLCLAFAGAASAQSLYGYNFRSTDTTPWAGPYVGVHGGHAIDEDDTTRVRGVLPGNARAIDAGDLPSRLVRDKDGYVAGGQVGWNVQHGPVVAGVEGDFSATDFSNRSQLVGLNGARTTISSRNNYLATIRGRLGYATPAGLLLYGTGGYATTQVRDKGLIYGPRGVPLFGGVHQYEPDGWVAGAGVEYAIPTSLVTRYAGFLGRSAVTTRVEWLHYDFRDKSLNLGAIPPGLGANVSRIDNEADVVRAGINYKF